jgi:hypothetical protein
VLAFARGPPVVTGQRFVHQKIQQRFLYVSGRPHRLREHGGAGLPAEQDVFLDQRLDVPLGRYVRFSGLLVRSTIFYLPRRGNQMTAVLDIGNVLKTLGSHSV